jgi:hypothetical protein
VTGNLRRLDEDRRADDRAGDHRDCVEARERRTEESHVRGSLAVRQACVPAKDSRLNQRLANDGFTDGVDRLEQPE